MARRRNKYADIKWNQQQVERLERAVNAYNQAIEDKAAEWGRSGLAFLLPPTVDLSTEIDYIQTASQLNARVASLNRIHRANAFDIDEERQMTQYEVHEGQVLKSQINRHRMQLAKKMGVEFRRDKEGHYFPHGSVSYLIVNETNIMPTSADITSENVHKWQRLMNNYRGGNREQLEIFWVNYQDQWVKFYNWSNEYLEVMQIITEVMEAPLEIQNEIFYHYDEYGSFDYLYPFYDRTPIERKAKNIAGYWRKVKATYLKE